MNRSCVCVATDPNWSSVSALSKREILEEGGPWRQFEETLEDSSAARIQHQARGQAFCQLGSGSGLGLQELVLNQGGRNWSERETQVY